MLKYLYIILFLSISCHISAQKFSLEPYIGIGGYVNEYHGQGRDLIGAQVSYVITSQWQINIEGFFGGNIFPGDPEVENGSRIVLNPRANKFNFIGAGARYNFRKEAKKSYPYFQTLLGYTNSELSSADLANTDGLENSGIGVALEAGYSLEQLKLSLRFVHFGDIDSFMGTSLDNRPVIMEDIENMIIVLKLGYTIQL